MSDEAPKSSRKGSQLFTKRNPPVGALPGALAIPDGAEPSRVFVMAYKEGALVEKEVESVEELRPLLDEYDVTWVDVHGLGSEETLREIGALFELHALALADVVNVPQRPKTESYDKHQLVILGMLRFHDGELAHEQLSLFVGRRYVLTFQERRGDVFEPVRKRLREGVGVIRSSGADLLGYAIVDVIVDGYYPVLETFAEELEDLEERVLLNPRPEVLHQVHQVKRTIQLVRRAVWPLRDALSTLIRDPIPLVTDSARMYLRDTYDHCIQVAEMTETYRELVSELTNTYMSVLGQRTNEVMRLLTVVTAVFIPLTFIVGVYGMNFDHMPELHARWGYPLTMLAMLVLAIVLLVFFRWRGWLGGPSDVTIEEDEGE
jgi:magnesium transporter